MARFTATVAGQAPLLVQLQSTATGPGSYLSVFAVNAETNGGSGSVSRPRLWRPSLPGSGTQGTIAEIRSAPSGVNQNAILLASFTNSPSLPIYSSGAFCLPIKISWLVDSLDGVIVANSGAIGLHAYANSTVQWDAGITWEEAG